MLPSITKTGIKTLIGVNLLVILFCTITDEMPGDSFGEGGLITLTSVANLLAIAGLSFLILLLNRDNQVHFFNVKGSHFFWFLSAVGFVFLALDEKLKIHENTDKLIHRIFNLQETMLTDSIDDFIILLYGVIGLIVIYFYRRDIKLFMNGKKYFALGFVLFVVTAGIDFLHNIHFVIPGFEVNDPKYFFGWYKVAEESVKLFAEVAFALGYYSCYTFFLESQIKEPRNQGVSFHK